MRRRILAGALAMLATGVAAQVYPIPQHTLPAPFLGDGTPREQAAHADAGIEIERDRAAISLLAEHRRMAATLAAVGPQRPGVVDAYVVVAALDSDPVFGREAREAARVLVRRYAADGRAILLAGTDGAADSAYPMGSPTNLALALARVAERMDPEEDVLILYTTSHGAPTGLFYHDADRGYGWVSPARLWAQLSTLGIRNRMLLLGACFSGVFVPMLSSDTTVIMTAAAADRTSFGCQADNDWTFFGDALLNHALRRPVPFAAAAGEATATIAGWEAAAKLDPSRPQLVVGDGARRWLALLEAKLPAATAPTGRPATAALAQ